MKEAFHDAPWMRVSDPEVLKKFLGMHGIDPLWNREVLICKVAQAFSKMPYENLTKIIKSDMLVQAQSAMRYPDELLGDYLRWGTGGTCFSLTAAIVAVYGALGIESHPVLADRYYGPDTHCGLIIVSSTGPRLIDPGYLLFTPTLLPSADPVYIDATFNKIELKPLLNGEKVELYTIVKGNRKLRLTYKVAPVDAVSFARAWEHSFAWEMMIYPVLTRIGADGCHQYLQGSTLSVRSDKKTDKIKLSIDSQIDYIATHMNIDRSIVIKAFGVTRHG